MGILAYPLFLYGGNISYTFPIPSAWGPYSVLMDELSSIVISVSSIVFLAVLAHMLRSASAPRSGKYASLACVLYIACVTAMCADTVLLILMAWETVTLATFLMSLRGKNGAAAWKFFVIAHIGGLMVICSFLVMMSYADGQTLSSWSGLGAVMGVPASCGAIILLFVGFGAKLGLIPFHAWMPDLYSSAPTHTSALMSTVSSNAAVLILFKSVFGYIGASEEMYVLAAVLMAASAFTAIWGALESLVQTEPKRILAYSSMENMALVLLCFSLGILFSNGGSSGLITMVLVAGLFHTVNHSVFKSLIMLTVGSAEDCTGETAIERMGGLAKLMPAFSIVSLIAILSMAAVPPFNGFAGEWLMVQSMMGGEGLHMTEIILPLGVAVLGISGMMAAVSYARLYGFMFLGRPRAKRYVPEKVGASALAPMVLLAALCFAMGIFATDIMDRLARGVGAASGIPSDDLYTAHLAETLNVPMLGGILLAAVFAVYGLGRLFGKKAARSPTWDCGTPLNEDMQYSSVGFSQPLVRVFHPLYGDVIELSDDDSSKDCKRYSIRFAEPFVERLYVPLGNLLMKGARYVGRTQNGNIQSYFGYILIVLVALLVAVRFA
jgi:formate hydrogenlyase subunit 3/multisubunit Na+/H+ antiporter MnhD subunit